MSGGFVMEWEDAAARVRLTELIKRGTNTRPLMLEIGYELVRSTLQRFDDEVDPDGNPWVELKPATLARKKGSKKLIEDGFLRGGIAVLEATDGFVEIGADREYAAIHQFGGSSNMAPGAAAILPRPYLGISSEDARRVSRIIVENLVQASL
ncbi:phage virion morphogenesis protein [Tahibacter soli]|uniref:Phage virion morphogenesis protein n=1 Tax=Tahibacter soli TaxID=2983605 RepID=A0A9X4BK80_9GAMM|nr:phage virion morphogenesis protein [Tahibacter soli]MDC8012929.1 phage virion morphogenesis protein [Tahibacter soli]